LNFLQSRRIATFYEWIKFLIILNTPGIPAVKIFASFEFGGKFRLSFGRCNTLKRFSYEKKNSPLSKHQEI